jgi:transcriptional regulator with XRE-family HTH domain
MIFCQFYSREGGIAMTHFGERLREERKRAGLTQEELAQKVEARDKSLSASYISKMETGLLPPPSRKAAVGLADALGMTNRPVTLYVSTKDRDALQRFVFFLTAYVAGGEDVQLGGLIEIKDRQAEEREKQESEALTYNAVNPAIGIPDSLLGSLGNKAEEIECLIVAACLPEDEEEEVVAALIEVTKQFLKIKKGRGKRKEG